VNKLTERTAAPLADVALGLIEYETHYREPGVLFNLKIEKIMNFLFKSR
jgi:hypothetical protein